MKHDARIAARRQLMQSAADFGFALAVFWGVTFASSPGHGTLLVLLSLIVAGMATVNLAFLRHLRRVYASPRRGVWRRV